MPPSSTDRFNFGLRAVGWLTAWMIAALCATAGTPDDAPVSFRHDVMAVLSKAGCNAGACHGNRSGKGGFKLSLRGEDPDADFLALTAGLAGRRLNYVAPEQSLLLLKPTTTQPHEGGLRLGPGSREYELLRAWITARAPDDRSRAARLVKLDVSPRERVLYEPDDRVALRVMASFSDGTQRDVTSLTCYEAANPIVAISPAGEVVRKQSGETTVLVRYLNQQVPVSLAFVPARPSFDAAQRPPEHNSIDRHIFAKLRQLHLNAAELCPDEVFCRRAYLDLLGLLPTADEARAFVADPRPDKRSRLVDTLLERPEFAEFWALKWLDLLRADERTLDTKGARALREWLRSGLAANRPLDELVRELIAARGSTYAVPAANFYRALRTPVERSEAAAQVFLGTRLQCAQCHNHPYERWTQDDYHDWTDLFERVTYRVIENRRPDENDGHAFIGEQIVVITNRGDHVNPRTGQPSSPRFLGVPQALAAGTDRLEALSVWLAGTNNARFALAQVNRLWFHLMGRGLVDPVDDFRATNPASHPALLDELAAELTRSGFDLRRIIRLIMASRTYQLASEPARGSEDDILNYSHNVVRRLAAEPLLDCLSQVCGVPMSFAGWPAGTRAAQLPGVRISSREGKRQAGEPERFLRTFGKPPRQLSSECERSGEPAMGQAFQLISGPTVQVLLNEPDNRLETLMNAKLSHRELVAELYWTVLTRAPSAGELEVLAAYLARATDRRAALEDVLWGLLNAKEFVLRR